MPAFIGYVSAIIVIMLLVCFIISVVQRNVLIIGLPIVVFAVYYIMIINMFLFQVLEGCLQH